MIAWSSRTEDERFNGSLSYFCLQTSCLSTACCDVPSWVCTSSLHISWHPRHWSGSLEVVWASTRQGSTFLPVLCRNFFASMPITLLLRQPRRCNVSRSEPPMTQVPGATESCHCLSGASRTGLFVTWWQLSTQPCSSSWAVHRKGTQGTFFPLCHWKPGPTNWAL